MKLKSLIQNANRLEVAEVEIEFIPGIPQIHFLGLPDRLIKESFYRIKSALKSCGYKFPLTSQMIVNIKPNHLRKSSRGVELAVALGILLKTEQFEASLIKPDWVIYGELGLDGNIYEPSDLAQNMIHFKNYELLTGQGEESNCYRIESLMNPEINFTQSPKKIQRPEHGIHRTYTKDEAEFLFLAATSGLHSLLAGDSGAGKSTLANSLISFLSVPLDDQRIRFENNWRPVIAPHQSITPSAFIGGGANLYEGEVERVQGGILLLDELLEFDPEILESLRGPMTGEKLRISRGSGFRELNSNFQVIATTNLCPCGKWTPLKKNISCRFSRQKCSRYLEKFSGPILDRFGILLYSTYREARKTKGSDILKRVQNYFDFLAQNPELLSKTQQPELLETYYQNLTTRRKNYLAKVSSIYALEAFAQGLNETKPSVNLIHHYNRAEQWVIRPFELLEKGMS